MKLRSILMGLLILASTLVLVACNTPGNGGNVPSGSGNHEHTFATEWSSNDLFHWYEPTCGHENEIKDKNYHEWDNGVVTTEPTLEADGVKTFTCTICSRTKTQVLPKLEAAEHEHTFETEWSKDETHHWYAATCEHATEVKDKATHNWNEGVVTTEPTLEAPGVTTYTCVDCNQTKEEPIDQLVPEGHEHTFETEWSKDETHHWYAATCEHTSQTKDKALHNWNEGVVTTEPTLEAPGVTTYTCVDCNQTKEEPIDQLVPEEHEHSFSDEWNKDESNHWHECSCGDKSELAAHTGGTATTTAQAVCTVCGTPYGDLAVAQDITLGFWTNDYSNSDGYTIYIYAWTDNGYNWFQCTLTDDNGAFGDYYTVTLNGYTDSIMKGFIVVRTTGPDWGQKVQQSPDLLYADYLATLARDGKVTYYL